MTHVFHKGDLKMEIDGITNLITNTTVTVVVIAYFMYKDLKFMKTLNETLKALEDSVSLIRNYFINKDNEGDDGK